MTYSTDLDRPETDEDRDRRENGFDYTELVSSDWISEWDDYYSPYGSNAYDYT